MRNQKGIAALLLVVVIIGIATIITLFSAGVIVTDNKIYNNMQNNAIALNAAQAGVDYALGYLNSTTANQNGVIVTGLTNCSLAANTICLTNGGSPTSCGASPPTSTLSSNNATYTMKYACVSAGNTNFLTISSAGTSADGNATRTVTETVYRYFGGGAPVVLYGTGNSGAPALTLNQSAHLYNTVTGSTQSVDTYQAVPADDGAISISGSGPAQTCGGATAGSPPTCPGGTYTCSGFESIPPAVSPATSCQDINFSDNNIKNIQAQANTATAFQAAFLGQTLASMQPTANYTVTCTSSPTFAAATTLTAGGACTCTGTNCATTALNGLNGKTVFMEMNANTLTLTLNGITMGTSGSPSYLIAVNCAAGLGACTGARTGASLSLINNNTIAGGLYSDSPISLASSASDTGAILTSSSVILNKSDTFTGSIYAQTLTLDKSSSITYDGVNGVLGGSNAAQYGIVTGSWKDF